MACFSILNSSDQKGPVSVELLCCIQVWARLVQRARGFQVSELWLRWDGDYPQCTSPTTNNSYMDHRAKKFNEVISFLK